MKTLIALPCMDNVDTMYHASLLGMRRVGAVNIDIKKGSMIFDARNEAAMDAITQEADRVLWIDTDMVFKNDMMERMSARLDHGCEMVCGLFFKRIIPTSPVIYKKLEPPTIDERGHEVPGVIPYTDYPKDSLFEVEGCGFGAVMMTTELLIDVWNAFKQAPFMPLDWCGEDMAFCYKVRQLGRKIWCDSSIKVGHMGKIEFNEQMWLNQENDNRKR